MLKKGEKVLMKNCVGARREPSRIWECITDEYEDKYKEKTVKLKDCDIEEFPVKMLEKYRAVYKLNDYEWYVTSWNLADTINWYNKQFEDEIDIDYIEAIDVEKEGMWIETTDSKDFNILGDSDELVSTKINNDGKRLKAPKFGDLMKGFEGQVLKFTSFKDVIKKHYLENPLKEPELIASTDF